MSCPPYIRQRTETVSPVYSFLHVYFTVVIKAHYNTGFGLKKKPQHKLIYCVNNESNERSRKRTIYLYTCCYCRKEQKLYL